MSTADRRRREAAAGEVDLTGMVVVRPINRGSKSERRAAFLDTGTTAIRLVRPSASPMRDPVLLRLAGFEIRCRGILADGRLILSAWRKTGRLAPATDPVPTTSLADAPP